MTYFVGALIRITGNFTNANGDPADPTIVRAKIRAPNQAKGDETILLYGTDVALVKDSVGNYHVDVNIDQAGSWCYGFTGTGAIQAASETDFDVEDSCFA